MTIKPLKASKAQIEQFLRESNLAIVGISQNQTKFGNDIFKTLQQLGYRIFPVHRRLKSFEGTACYESISTLPNEVSALIVCTNPENCMELVQHAVAKGINNIWLQQGSQNDEAIFFAQQNGVNIIHRECIYMFTEPVQSIHKFHRSINKFFGIYPN